MTDLFYPQKSSISVQNAAIPSQSTRHLEQLQRRVPVVGDRALIELVNGIQVSFDFICYRQNRGFFGRLIDTLDRSDARRSLWVSKRQLLLEGNLLAGQEALSDWVIELCDSLRISQVGLAITQNSLLGAYNAIRHQQQRLKSQEEALLQLEHHLHQLAQQVGTRLNELEARVRKLEVRLAANEDLEQIVSAWASGKTYTQLPWAVQVTLLAREVFSSSVAMYEMETGDKKSGRQLLVNKILATSKHLPQSYFGLADLLDQSWVAMAQYDRELAALLLEIRSVPSQRLVNTPHLFVIGTTLELATLPEDARPIKPAASAIALCRAQIDSISRTTDAREFVTAIVEQTADDCLASTIPNAKCC